jgi:Flp pilus assembly protein TadG
MSKVRLFLRQLRRQVRGSVAVEFGIIAPVLILLVAGILDFGHAWFMKQVVTNASREGARYGVTYRANTTGVRIAPNGFSPTIQNYVLTNYLTNAGLPSDANPNVTLAGAGLTTGTHGSPLEVTVTATKKWFVISMVPGMGTQHVLTATTVMLCE